MLTVDGTDGGGQVLRTALALSVVTDRPFRIEDVRGARPDPGLKPQHLAAVDLLATLCGAEVEGDELGSDSLAFAPGEERRTSLRADVATAGSVTLLFDAVLPIAAATGGPLRVEATGGTDVKWSPTAAYLGRVKFPLLAARGFDAHVSVDRTGFYPAGGGEATLETTSAPSSRPSSSSLSSSSSTSPTLSPFDLVSRGSLERVVIHSKAAESLAHANVADRQADHASDLLADADVPAEIASVDYVETDSPGSALLVTAVYENSVAGFDAVGERGLPSESVAAGPVERFVDFDAGSAAVDEHMADQLLCFLALAGGRIRIPAVTGHVRSNCRVIEAFGGDVTLASRDDGTTELVVSSPLMVD